MPDSTPPPIYYLSGNADDVTDNKLAWIEADDSHCFYNELGEWSVIESAKVAEPMTVPIITDINGDKIYFNIAKPDFNSIKNILCFVYDTNGVAKSTYNTTTGYFNNTDATSLSMDNRNVDGYYSMNTLRPFVLEGTNLGSSSTVKALYLANGNPGGDIEEI